MAVCHGHGRARESERALVEIVCSFIVVIEVVKLINHYIRTIQISMLILKKFFVIFEIGAFL